MSQVHPFTERSQRQRIRDIEHERMKKNVTLLYKSGRVEAADACKQDYEARTGLEL